MDYAVALPDATLLYYRGAGHNLIQDRPDDTFAAIGASSLMRRCRSSRTRGSARHPTINARMVPHLTGSRPGHRVDEPGRDASRPARDGSAQLGR
jgi:hypothetical protein